MSGNVGAVLAGKSRQQIWSGSEAPEARYLILALDDAQVISNRPVEMVFTGQMVPEPASLGLVAIGGLMMGRRRRG